MPASASRCSSAREPAQIEAAVALGAPVIEIHTGAWCDALDAGPRRAKPMPNGSCIRAGALLAKSSAWKCMPATGSTTRTAETIAALPEVVELNIGHFLVGEAVFEGLAETVRVHARRHGRGGRGRRL